MNFWKSRMFCIITGASRGLGRTVATQFCQHVETGSVFLILARNEDGLEETKRRMLERNNSIKVIIKAIDLSQPNWTEYSKILTDTLKYLEVSPENFDRSLLVHNAGSVGTLFKNSETLTDIQELRNYLDLNLNSVVILTSVYLKYFKENRFIINISSLAALQAYEGWHLYCIGKAARDSYFRVVAADKNVSVLSYAPGPLDTDMINEIAKNGTKEQQEWVSKLRNDGTFVPRDTTVTKLMDIVEKGCFKSGDHIDYYDKI